MTEADSAVILRNLPLSASISDVRQFFQPINIPIGGVNIIGGDNGEAFINFSSNEEAHVALLLNGREINNVSIELKLIPTSQAKNIIQHVNHMVRCLIYFHQFNEPSSTLNMVIQLPIFQFLFPSIVNQSITTSVAPCIQNSSTVVQEVQDDDNDDTYGSRREKSWKISSERFKSTRRKCKSRSRSRDNDRSRYERITGYLGRSSDNGNNELDVDNDRNEYLRQIRDKRARDIINRNNNIQETYNRKSEGSPRYDLELKTAYRTQMNINSQVLSEAPGYNHMLSNIERNGYGIKQFENEDNRETLEGFNQMDIKHSFGNTFPRYERDINNSIDITGKRERSRHNQVELKHSFGNAVSSYKGDINNYVVITGMLNTVTVTNVIDYFKDVGIVPNNVYYELDVNGNRTGVCYCEFSSEADAILSLKKNGVYVNGRMTSLKIISSEQMNYLLSSKVAVHNQYPNLRFPPTPYTRNLYNHVPSVPPPWINPRIGYIPFSHPPVGAPIPIFPTSSARYNNKECTVTLKNIPYNATVKDILNFFQGYNVLSSSVIKVYDEAGRFTGCATVRMKNSLMAQKAVSELQNYCIGNRNIKLHLDN